MLINRVAWRNVYFYNASTGATLGGFHQKGSLTEATLIWIFSNVLLVVDRHWTVKHRESSRTITPSSNPVVLGDYDIYSEGKSFLSNIMFLKLICLGAIQVSDEAWFA